MARPNQDRVKIEAWVRRSSLAWLDEQAAALGVSRSELVRRALAAYAETLGKRR